MPAPASRPHNATEGIGQGDGEGESEGEGEGEGESEGVPIPDSFAAWLSRR